MKNILLLLITFFMSSLTFSQTKLVFTYDAAGNQTERKFETTRASKQLSTNVEEEAVAITEFQEDDILEQIANAITIYPNPTKGNLRLEWEDTYSDSIKAITVTDSGAQNTFQVPLQKEQNYVDVNLTNYALGMYIIHFILDDTQIVVKKIIKN